MAKRKTGKELSERHHGESKEKKTCVALMPFDDKFNNVDAAMKRAATEVGLEYRRLDKRCRAERITPRVLKEIRRSCVCVFDFTGLNSNVLWEHGFVTAIGKPCIVFSQPWKSLPFNINDVRVLEYNPDDLQNTLETKLVEALKEVSRETGRMSIEEACKAFPHPNWRQVVASAHQQGSTFELLDLLRSAKRKLFVAGQNLYFLVRDKPKSEKFKEEIFKFLRRDDSEAVEIMFCKRDRCDYAVRTWQDVVGKGYKSHLYQAERTFRRWQKEANDDDTLKDEKGQVKLAIRQTTFVPLSISFVDPDNEDDGFLVVVPNTYEKFARVRVTFALSKKTNDDIFHQYWVTYSETFADQSVTTSVAVR